MTSVSPIQLKWDRIYEHKHVGADAGHKNPDYCLVRNRAVSASPHRLLVLPTDMPQAALHRLGRVVDAISEAFRQVAGARHCRSWIPHPDDCDTRRLHVLVDSDVPFGGGDEKEALWRAVSARVREAIHA